MTILFIGSTGDHAGQSLVAWAIAKRLNEKGLKVGFFKPFGTRLIRLDDQWTDPDAFLFKNILNLPEPLERICPYMTAEMIGDHQSPTQLMEEIKSRIQETLIDRDILIVLGAKHIFFDDVPHPLPDTTIINELNAYLVLTHRYKKISTSLYSILSVISLLREKVKGVIINRIPDQQFDNIGKKITQTLIQSNIANVTALHEDPILSQWSIREILNILHGEVIWGEEHLERTVDGMTVGTADLKGELLLFKKVYNKIILLGPSDVHSEQKNILESRTIVGILLTGNRKPPEKIVETAKRSNIPLILIKDDTFSAKEQLETNTPTLTSADQDKVVHFTKMMDRDGFLNHLIGSLGIIQ